MPVSKQRRLIAVTRSGTMIEDPNAFEEEEEIFSNAGTPMAWDDDREVPYYIHYEEGAPPTLVGYCQPYTGGSKSISQDGHWRLVKAPTIYYGAANSLHADRPEASRTRKMGMWILGVGAGIAFFFLLLIAWNMQLSAERELLKEANKASQPAAPAVPAVTTAPVEASQ